MNLDVPPLTAVAVPRRAADAAERVEQTLAEVRCRNAVTVSYLRLVIATLLPPLHALNAVVYGSRFHAQSIWRSAGFLCVAATVAWALRRRWRVELVAYAAVVVDAAFIATQIRAQLLDQAPADLPISLGASIAGGQLVLLCGAFVLQTPAVAAMVAAATLATAGAVASAGYSLAYLVGYPVITLVFGAAVAWAGRRLVGLAVDRTLAWHVQDLTHQHAMAIASANARLRAAQLEAERLTQLIVHDLRNPLQAILSTVEAVRAELARTPAASRLGEELLVAESEGRRLAAMVGDLLLVSRLEREGVRARPQPVVMAALLQEVATAQGRSAASRQVALESEAVPDLVARVDLALLQRALENLVTNALRFCHAGDRIRLVAEARGTRVTVAVRNTGKPVPASVCARLFERHATGGDQGWQGAGLGLYLCRLVAEAHGGTIDLVDRPGWSVSFELDLPGAQSDPA